MSIVTLKTGDKIEIKEKISMNKLKNLDGKMKVYLALVEKTESDNSIVITAPIYKNVLYRLESNKEYIFTVFHEKHVYEFEGIGIDYFKKRGLDFVSVKLKTKIKRIQRRQYFRLHHRIPIKFATFEELEKNNAEKELKEKLNVNKKQALEENLNINEKQILNESEREDIMITKDIEQFIEEKLANTEELEIVEEVVYINEGLMHNISGGGLRFSSNYDLEENTKVNCAFSINNKKYKINARLIYRNSPPIEKKAYKYKFEYSMKFIEISDKDRDAIVIFIFENQIKSNSKNKKTNIKSR